MEHEVAILFQHHQNDTLTQRRYENLKKLNPGVPVIPLTHNSNDVLPGTFDLASVPGLENEQVWYDADLPTYFWFTRSRTRETTASRYVYVEYDMLMRVPVREFYREVWEADVAGAQVFHAGPNHHWNWFPGEIPKLSLEMVPYAAGVTPLCGVFLSHRALSAITSYGIPLGLYSEVRLATLANFLGFDLVELPWEKKRNLTWKPEFVRMDIESQAYHPVKHLTPWDEG